MDRFVKIAKIHVPLIARMRVKVGLFARLREIMRKKKNLWRFGKGRL